MKKHTEQKPWDAAKAVLRGEFTVVNVYIKEDIKSII